MMGAQPLSNRRPHLDDSRRIDTLITEPTLHKELTAVRLTFGFCDGYRPRRPGLHGPSVSTGRRPDLLSPCRGDLRLARAAFDRKPRLWPDCRFVGSAAASGSLPLLLARRAKAGGSAGAVLALTRLALAV